MRQKSVSKIYQTVRCVFFVCLVVSVWRLVPASAAETRGFLVLNQASDYQVVVDDFAIPAERHAAEELVYYLEKSTGVKLPIRIPRLADRTAPWILVGAGSDAKTLWSEIDWEKLGSDGIVISAKGKNLLLAGGRPRGTLYAVYQFLEDQVGVRWWSPETTDIPERKTIGLPTKNVVYVPPLEFRDLSIPHAWPAEYSAHLRLNGHHAGGHHSGGAIGAMPEHLGGKITYIGPRNYEYFVHTYKSFFPADGFEWARGDYFQKFPEFFGIINGQRTAKTLAVMNKKMRQALAEKALSWIANETVQDARILDISPNDYIPSDQSPEAVAFAQQYGGVVSAPYLDMVNEVAQTIRERYPQVWLSVLAYWDTVWPPQGMKAEPNVMVRLCSLDFDNSRPLQNDPTGQFPAILEGWKKTAGKIWVWNYGMNFGDTLAPYPNLRSIGPTIRWLTDNGVSGFFQQGSGAPPSDFAYLKNWVIAKLMWNPYLDADVLIKEFLEGYYGKAGEYLYRYIHLLHNAIEEEGTYLLIYHMNLSFMTYDTIQQGLMLFDQAEQSVADNPELLRRVQIARVPLTYALYRRYPALKQEAYRRGEDWEALKNPQEKFNNLLRFSSSITSPGQDYSQMSADSPSVSYFHRHVYQNLAVQRKFPASAPEGIEKTKRWFEAQDYDLWPALDGATEVVEDGLASDGVSLALTKPVGWAVQYFPCGVLQKKQGKVRVIAYIRLESDENVKGEVLRYGCYDRLMIKHLADEGLDASGLSQKEYKPIDLGLHDLRHARHLWFSMSNNSAVRKILFDRLVFVFELSQ